jgi:hypothetical protein
MDDIVITIQDKFDDEHYIEWVHLLEKTFDESLSKLGYGRTGTDKLKDQIILKYYQFGIAL